MEMKFGLDAFRKSSSNEPREPLTISSVEPLKAPSLIRKTPNTSSLHDLGTTDMGLINKPSLVEGRIYSLESF